MANVGLLFGRLAEPQVCHTKVSASKQMIVYLVTADLVMTHMHGARLVFDLNGSKSLIFKKYQSCASVGTCLTRDKTSPSLSAPK